MFTSLKKLMNKNEGDEVTKPAPPAGMQTMKSELQRKFAKGIQYNMKIAIRGERNSGKSCLWHRLQGHKFVEDYSPTQEIQVASIHWNYKATDDVVKVDVWDVVDKGKSKKPSDAGLKLQHTDDEDEQHCLDARFVDVYQGTHACIMVFDITKRWTFTYVEQQLPKVPAHIPVLVLANHRDMGEHRVVDAYELKYTVDAIQRPPGSASIMTMESSMKDGFGLKFVHKFFNLPFLMLQRESLLKQLETNYLDVESCLEELSFQPDFDDKTYDNFVQQRKARMSSSTTPTVTSPSKVMTSPNKVMTSPSPPTSSVTSPPPTSPKQVTEKKPENQPPPPTPEASTEGSKIGGFMSKFFGNNTQTPPTKPEPPATIPPPSVPRTPSSGVTNIDDFVPDDGEVDNFLNEPEPTNRKPPTSTTTNNMDDSSDDEDGGNPMVAGFQEELDSDDQISNSSHQQYLDFDDSDGEGANHGGGTKSPTTANSPSPVMVPKPGSDEGESPYEIPDIPPTDPLASFNPEEGGSDPLADFNPSNDDPLADFDPSSLATYDDFSPEMDYSDNGYLNTNDGYTNDGYTNDGYKNQVLHDIIEEDSMAGGESSCESQHEIVSNYIEDVSSDDEKLPKDDVIVTSSSNHMTSSNYEEPSSAASSVVVTSSPGDDVTLDDVTPTLQLQSTDLQFLETLSYDKTESKTEEEPTPSEGKKSKKSKEERKKKKKKREKGEKGEKRKTKKSSSKESNLSLDAEEEREKDDLEAFLES